MDFLHTLLHSLGHPLWETLKMAPILFLAYLFMEWLEHNASAKLFAFVNKSRRFGPLLGSSLGLIPQCGFSGAIAGMYAAGTVTTGTLLAVILSTSDEMLPLMLGTKISAKVIISVLLVKFISGIIVGFITDFIQKKRHRENSEHIHEFCQQENCSCSDGVWLSALKHTIKILVIIYLVSAILHLVVELVPDDIIKTALNFPIISQITAAVLGLIPSCAVSVTMTQLYIEGALGIGPLLCGLLTNGGVGLLVLYRVNRNRKDNLIITFTILASGLIIGSIAGILLN
jgi:hypothetical protein